MIDILIIGAGITGTLLARELAKYKLCVVVIEKENDVGNVTTNANSAIIHSGYDPLPGTLKAKLNVLGNAKYPQLCKELDVDFEQNGTLTIALYNEQLPILEQLAKRSQENGVEVSLLSAEEVKKMEPNINPDVKGALFAKSGGIVDPFNLAVHAMENAVDNGVSLFLDEEVIGLTNKGDYYLVTTTRDTYETRMVINAAGLGCEKVARMVEDVDWKIIPRKGEYFVLDHFQKGLVNRPIFPLPSEKGKGILVTNTTSGDYLLGPSSEPVDSIEDFATDLLTLNNVKKQALDLVPSVPLKEIIRVFAGLRPTTTRHDFIIETAKDQPYFIHVAGIESPGLASSPAIAEYVVENLIKPVMNLKVNKHFIPYVKPYVHINRLLTYEARNLIKQNEDYGKIVCSCEHVSKGEIIDLFSRSVPPHTVKAVKRRVRAGFGRCQGSFCSPTITLMLAKHYNISPLEVKWDRDGSEILKVKVKDN